MKTLFASALLIGAAVLSAQAQPRANTCYANASLGGNWVQDTQLKELFGPVTGNNDVKLDPGLSFGAAAGYNITDWFAAEAGFGINWNNVDQLGDAQRLDAIFANMPMLVNVKLQLPNPSVVRPYIGAGVGGASSVLDIDHLDYGNTHIFGSASDFSFCWQGFAGVQFQLSEQMSLGVEYHYSWTQGPEFDIGWGWYYYSGDHLRLGDIETHSVSVIFAYQF